MWEGQEALLPAQVRAVRPGIHVLESRVDDFDVRAVVVVGSRAALVWDTLAHPRQMAPVSRIGRGARILAAYSHGDWDHVWGTAALGPLEDVIAHEACARRFDGEAGEELAQRREAEPGRWDDVVLVPPTRTFDASLDVDLGDVVVHLAHLPGHTPDCCVAWIPSCGVLLAGDTVETPLPVVNDGGAVAPWVAALRRWAGEPGLELVVPSHGRIGGREVIEETLAYLEALTCGRAAAPEGGQGSFYARTHEENLRLMEEARPTRR